MSDTPKPRRRHKAAGSRVVASGLGAGAMLGIVGAFGAHAATTGTTTAAVSPSASAPKAAATRHPVPTTTPTTIVWKVVHRVIVVNDPPVSGGSSSTSGARWHPTYSSAARPGRQQPGFGAGSRRCAGAGSLLPRRSPHRPPPAPAPAPAPIPACHGSKCP